MLGSLRKNNTIIPGNLVTVTAVSFIDWLIPSGVRKLTLVYDRVTVSTGSFVSFGITAGIVTTGYTSTALFTGIGTGIRDSITNGLQLPDCTGSVNSSGVVNYLRIGDTNQWVCSGQSQYGLDFITLSSGRIQLSSELKKVRIQPPSGTFTAGGTLQLFWEF